MHRLDKILFTCLSVTFLKEQFVKLEARGDFPALFTVLKDFCLSQNFSHLTTPHLKIFLIHKFLYVILLMIKVKKFHAFFEFQVKEISVEEFISFFLGKFLNSNLNTQRFSSESEFLISVIAIYFKISDPKYNFTSKEQEKNLPFDQSKISQIKYKIGVFAMINLTDIYLSLKNYSERLKTVYIPAILIELSNQIATFPLQATFERSCDFTSNSTFKLLLGLIYLSRNKFDLLKAILDEVLNSIETESGHSFD